MTAAETGSKAASISADPSGVSALPVHRKTHGESPATPDISHVYTPRPLYTPHTITSRLRTIPVYIHAVRGMLSAAAFAHHAVPGDQRNPL